MHVYGNVDEGCDNNGIDTQAGENKGKEWWKVDANLGFMRLRRCGARQLGEGECGQKDAKKYLKVGSSFQVGENETHRGEAAGAMTIAATKPPASRKKPPKPANI
jgi:hypothetical protein